MYSPATYETADVIGTFLVRRGLYRADFSYGAAVGLFNSIINLGFLIAANRLARRLHGAQPVVRTGIDPRHLDQLDPARCLSSTACWCSS